MPTFRQLEMEAEAKGPAGLDGIRFRDQCHLGMWRLDCGTLKRIGLRRCQQARSEQHPIRKNAVHRSSIVVQPPLNAGFRI
jgi:hypothetical protein